METIKKRLAITLSLVIMIATACSAQPGKLSGNAAPPQSTAPTAPASAGTGTLLPLEYYSPQAKVQYVSKGDTIILRYGPSLSNDEVARLSVAVTGAKSGNHSGKLILADDGKTVIYKPDQSFTPGEQVQVLVNSLKLTTGEVYQPLSYTFSVATNQQPGVVAGSSVPTSVPQSAYPNALTVPQDIPHYSTLMLHKPFWADSS